MSKYINTSKISSSNVLKTIFYVIGFVTGIPNILLLFTAMFVPEAKSDDVAMVIIICIFFFILVLSKLFGMGFGMGFYRSSSAAVGVQDFRKRPHNL